jgi:hypothetical protein
LEQVWQGEQPVLFIGCIKDVSSDGAATYQLVVEKGFFKDYVFATELRLALRAPKASIDSFLKEHPELLTTDVPTSGIAVVAKIANMSTRDERDQYGERVEIKTGHGELLGLVYTGDVFYRADLKAAQAEPAGPEDR